MSEWLPRFACPRCMGHLDPAGDAFACPSCARSFAQRQRIWRYLLPERHAAIEPFLRQYRAVRERDGYRASAADYYRSLPHVDPSDPEADAWRVRQQSYRTLERHMRQQSGSRTMTVLDLGAGNGWLSNRFALHGHRAVAVDWLDDERDGLGATRHYGTPLVCVQADFDALPFEAAQFDLVVFNGSLHYAHDVRITLGRARRLVAPGGALVVVDSPFFRRTLDGHAMVEEKTRRFFFEYGISEVVHEGVGFVTFRDLEAAASALRLRGRFYRSRGPLGWQLRRAVGGLRRLRQPAAFGVWVAR